MAQRDDDNARDLSGLTGGYGQVDMGAAPYQNVLSAPGGSGGFMMPTGNQFQNPYLTVNPNVLQQGNDSEFLFPKAEDKGRSFSEKASYTTGASYIAGSLIGAGYGVVEGLRHPNAVTTKLKINTVLNAAQKRGPFLGNTLGVIVLMYNVANYGICKVRQTDKPHALDHIAAATVAGGLYRSASGPRAAALGSITGLALASTFFIGKALVTKSDDTSLLDAIQEKQYS